MHSGRYHVLYFCPGERLGKFACIYYDECLSYDISLSIRHSIYVWPCGVLLHRGWFGNVDKRCELCDYIVVVIQHRDLGRRPATSPLSGLCVVVQWRLLGHQFVLWSYVTRGIRATRYCHMWVLGVACREPCGSIYVVVWMCMSYERRDHF